MKRMVLIEEWDADTFHQKVRELEEQGYAAHRETYNITPETDPNTGKIIHLHTIEMHLQERDEIS